MTEAGKKMVAKFLEQEQRGLLLQVRDSKTGEVFGAMALENNNGAQKATAEKLTRDGYANMQWTRSLGSHRGRYVWLTEKGRAIA